MDIETVITFTDGASRGNPGPAGIGALLLDEKEKILAEEFEYIGETTNNEAEYRALLMALNKARQFTKGRVRCFMDSELVARQLNGRYAIKSLHLIKIFDEVRECAAQFKSVTFSHVPREHPQQRVADALANKAIDQKRRRT